MDGSLYERLGGVDAITAVVRAVVDRQMKDDRINQKFARPNLFIKIPAARQGLLAIAVCLAEGINVNITLIFSPARYDEVMDAFLDGLEGARQAGLDLASIASVASFFVSRVDTEVDAPAWPWTSESPTRRSRWPACAEPTHRRCCSGQSPNTGRNSPLVGPGAVGCSSKSRPQQPRANDERHDYSRSAARAPCVAS